MQTLFSTLRLTAGCWALFLGLVLVSSADLQPNVWGVVVGGMGLALTLHETAFIHARFMKAAE